MPRFPKTYCSQCGGEFGPGDEGYSHCSDHQPPATGLRGEFEAYVLARNNNERNAIKRDRVGDYVAHGVHCAWESVSNLQAWRPIETAPEDKHILIATSGGHVGTAYWTDEGDGKVWAWGHPQKDNGQYVHPNLEPLGWMPLPAHPDAK